MVDEHGGARSGAGRKVKRFNKPVVMRVPAEYERAVRALIAFIDQQSETAKGVTVESDVVYTHTDTVDLKGGTVHVSFKAFKVT